MDALALAPFLISFGAIATHGGLRPASRSTGVSTATLSRHLAQLEAALSERLVERTPRRFRLTPAGERLHARLGLVENALNGMLDEIVPPDRLTGRVRFSAPAVLADTILAPVLARFALDTPGVVVEAVIGDRFVPLIDVADVVVRSGPLPDTGHIGRRLFTDREVLVAAPARIPDDPYDVQALLETTWVMHTPTEPAAGRVYREPGGREVRFDPPRRIETDNASHGLSLIHAGAGVGIALASTVEPALASGALVRLPWTGRAVAFYVLFARGSTVARPVRALVDALLVAFADR